ncbi:small ubiquitin-related modifier 1 [Spinacia oleracea]|uniref:Small ubiquitin-related modifier 1 n=1 Tax=Spinacia oleracea TaxID=3562 RepID=A0A9R0IZY9_SPIOL|nr:small ubiquitin-related modifier 1-like [Spinacia oleracea]
MAIPPVEQINVQDSTTEIKLESSSSSSKSHVTLKIQGADDHDVYYRVKRDFPLHHMKLDFCNRLGVDYGVVRFVFGKTEVRGAKTPDDLKMKNGDSIISWVDKIGG